MKLGAQIASTGKSDIMASIFAIASNDFMPEYHDKTHQGEEEAPAAEEEGGCGSKRRNRGNNHGQRELFDLERVVMEKEVQLLEVARSLGPDEYTRRCKRIDTSLKSKDENLREQKSVTGERIRR